MWLSNQSGQAHLPECQCGGRRTSDAEQVESRDDCMFVFLLVRPYRVPLLRRYRILILFVRVLGNLAIGRRLFPSPGSCDECSLR